MNQQLPMHEYLNPPATDIAKESTVGCKLSTLADRRRGAKYSIVSASLVSAAKACGRHIVTSSIRVPCGIPQWTLQTMSPPMDKV